ncbi:hypothetical protein YN1HA_17980 [Sulfurisphaera ohwakuensis]
MVLQSQDLYRVYMPNTHRFSVPTGMLEAKHVEPLKEMTA